MQLRLIRSDDSRPESARRPGGGRGRLAGAAAAIALSSLLGCASSPPASAGAPLEIPETVEPDVGATHPTLRAALLDLRARDQAARAAMIAAMQTAERSEDGGIRFDAAGMQAVTAVKVIDAESTAFLKQAVARHGWPTIDMVGEDGASAAWILAQHADAEPAFQAEVLALMEPLVAEGQAAADDFALLTDRVLRARGLPQRYGTQFTTDAEGVSRPAPIEDAHSVDERRAAVGLPPLAEYARIIGESYGGPTSPEPMPLEQD